MKKLFYFLIIILLPLYVFAEKNLHKKTKQILNDKTVTDPFLRWKAAFDTVHLYYLIIPYEEAVPLFNDLLLPFVEKEIKDKRKQYQAKACTYDNLGSLLENGESNKDMFVKQPYLEKAITFAELSKNEKLCAELYREYGRYQSEKGSIPLAHVYLYKAINLYELLNEYNEIFRCQFFIAENLAQTRDIKALGKLLEQMQENLKKQSGSEKPYNLYSFYSVQGAYFSLLSEDNPNITAYNDSMLLSCRNLIHVVESNMENLRKIAAIAFAYYNMAHAYEKCYPERSDSISYFLERALELKTPLRMINVELEISVYQAYAELHFKQKRYKEAEKDMLYVLALLEEMKDYNSVVAEFAEAYKFMITYYETLNRPDEVVKYQKLLLENERKRYDNDKIAAMDEMLVKYEVEKHKEKIERLAEQNRAKNKILILFISLMAVLIIIILILIHFYKLRKKNLEQSAYESALLAELKQNELESIKQQIEQKPVKNMMGKLTEFISQSVLDKVKIKFYLQQLSELDLEMLEQTLRSADEKISGMDMKYMLCFAIDMDVKDMSLLFNVEPASIRTVRYRIKKKFREKTGFISLFS